MGERALVGKRFQESSSRWEGDGGRCLKRLLHESVSPENASYSGGGEGGVWLKMGIKQKFRI